MEDLASIKCEMAQRDKRNATWWRNAWTVLLFVVGMAITVFVVAAIVWYARKDWLPGAASTLGAVISGRMVKFLLDRRAEAVQEENVARDRVREDCPAIQADSLVREARLFRL